MIKFLGILSVSPEEGSPFESQDGGNHSTQSCRNGPPVLQRGPQGVIMSRAFVLPCWVPGSIYFPQWGQDALQWSCTEGLSVLEDSIPPLQGTTFKLASQLCFPQASPPPASSSFWSQWTLWPRPLYHTSFVGISCGLLCWQIKRPINLQVG